MPTCPKCRGPLSLSLFDFIPIRGRHRVGCSSCSAQLAVPRGAQFVGAAIAAVAGCLLNFAALPFLAPKTEEWLIFSVLIGTFALALLVGSVACRGATDELIATHSGGSV
jgi:hypothetical protein